MALLPTHLTHLAVRWVHVVGMATLVGGSLLVWGMLRRDAGAALGRLRAATTYEWLFWAGAGLLVLTGVGNLGALAPAVPGPGTAWGAAFAAKLLGALVLLLGSLVRTLGVVRLLAGDATTPPAGAWSRLRAAYGATAVLLLVVVALAEVLAHG